MIERINGLREFFRRDPNQTRLIFRVGLGVPVAIALWTRLGELILPEAVVAFVALVLTVAFGTTLAFLVARLVHLVDRWEFESTTQAQRLMQADRRRGASDVFVEEPAPVLLQPEMSAPLAAGVQSPFPIVRPEPVSPPLLSEVVKAVEASRASASRFHEAFFLLRLTADLQKARREGSQLSVLVLQVKLSPSASEEDQLEELAYDLAKVVSSLDGQVSVPLQIGPTEFALYLKGTNRQAAEGFMRGFIQALSHYWCQIGLAVYPENGTQPEDLLELARDRVADVQTPRSRGVIGTLLRRPT